MSENTPEQVVLGNIQQGVDAKDSMKESKELVDKLLDLADGEEIEKEEYIPPVRSTKKTSSVREYPKTKKGGIPILKLGEAVTHQKHGNGFVIESKKEGDSNFVSVEYENKDQYDYIGTDQEIFSTLKKEAQETGEVIKLKDAPEE